VWWALRRLYWYYGSQTYEVLEDGALDVKLVHSSEAFRGSVTCTFTRFWV